jgi:CBS domain-containing protein
MTCRDYMISSPPTLAADTTVSEAVRLLAGQRLFALPVADAAGSYGGLFGVYDVLGLLLPSGTGDGLVPDLGSGIAWPRRPGSRSARCCITTCRP